MKILSKTKEKIVMTGNISETLANALRRSTSDINTLAIDEVEFFKNDSVLNDQMLAHRIGLVPLKHQDLERREECSCKGEGCAKCTIQLKLSVKGPGIAYAKDLKGKAEVVFEDMPLVLLSEEQEVEFIAYARVGKGIEHAKYTPGLVYYRKAFNVDSSKGKEILEKYKDQTAVIEKTGNSILVDAPEACLHELEQSGVKVEPSEQLVFIVESFGQTEAKEIFLQSIKVLREGLKHLSKD